MRKLILILTVFVSFFAHAQDAQFRNLKVVDDLTLLNLAEASRMDSTARILVQDSLTKKTYYISFYEFSDSVVNEMDSSFLWKVVDGHLEPKHNIDTVHTKINIVDTLQAMTGALWKDSTSYTSEIVDFYWGSAGIYYVTIAKDDLLVRPALGNEDYMIIYVDVYEPFAPPPPPDKDTLVVYVASVTVNDVPDPDEYKIYFDCDNPNTPETESCAMIVGDSYDLYQADIIYYDYDRGDGTIVSNSNFKVDSLFEAVGITKLRDTVFAYEVPVAPPAEPLGYFITQRKLDSSLVRITIDQLVDTIDARPSGIWQYEVVNNSDNNWTVSFTLENTSVISYNGQDLPSSQWSGGGTTTLNVTLTTYKYDRITVIH